MKTNFYLELLYDLSKAWSRSIFYRVDVNDVLDVYVVANKLFFNTQSNVK